MEATLDAYRDLLSKGFAGGHAVFPAFTNLGDDTLAVLVRHPDANLECDGAVLLINSRLATDELFQQRFKSRISDLCDFILQDQPQTPPVYLTLCYFCAAVDTGHVDPFCAPLSREVKLSGMTGWAADMIATAVWSRYFDCGSKQQEKPMPEGIE